MLNIDYEKKEFKCVAKSVHAHIEMYFFRVSESFVSAYFFVDIQARANLEGKRMRTKKMEGVFLMTLQAI